MDFHTFILILHILGACVVFGVVFFSLVFSVKKPLSLEQLKAVQVIRDFGLFSMALQVITGIILAYQEKEALESKLLWAKLILIVIDYVVAVRLIKSKVDSAVSNNDAAKAAGVSTQAWISFVIFLVIITLGVLLAESL